MELLSCLLQDAVQSVLESADAGRPYGKTDDVVIQGHLHPVIHVAATRRRCPCFALQEVIKARRSALVLVGSEDKGQTFGADR